jgi:hypothetical protein
MSPTATERTPDAAAPTAQPLTMAGALNAALRDAMEADDRVVVYGEDVGPLGGVFRVTDGLQARFGDERVWDSPLAEAGIVGTAVGMAVYGLRPVVEMQFDAFAYPAFEQIVSHVAKMRNRTKGHVTLPIVVRIPCAGAIAKLYEELGGEARIAGKPESVEHAITKALRDAVDVQQVEQHVRQRARIGRQRRLHGVARRAWQPEGRHPQPLSRCPRFEVRAHQRAGQSADRQPERLDSGESARGRADHVPPQQLRGAVLARIA